MLSMVHGRNVPPSAHELRALLFEHGRNATRDGLMLAAAETRSAKEPAWRDALVHLADTSEPILPFSGADLAARGIVPGKAMGEALARLRAAWIAADFPSDARRLANLLDTLDK